MDVSRVLVGTVAVLAIRAVIVGLSNRETGLSAIFGRPPEMKDVDNTSLGGPVYEAAGPFAIRK